MLEYKFSDKFWGVCQDAKQNTCLLIFSAMKATIPGTHGISNLVKNKYQKQFDW